MPSLEIGKSVRGREEEKSDSQCMFLDLVEFEVEIHSTQG